MLSARKKEKSVAKHARNRTLSEGIKLEVEWDEEFKFSKSFSNQKLLILMGVSRPIFTIIIIFFSF